MTVRVEVDGDSGLHHVVDDERGPVEPVNAFLRALTTRGLSPMTGRAYAYDLVAVYRWLTATNRELSALTQADLLDFIAHERRREARPRSIDRRLFVCLQGKSHGHAMTSAGLRSLFRHRRKKLDLDQANPHRFRHTFGADMARRGLPLPVIQRLMDHANPEMTLQSIDLSMADIARAYREAARRIRASYALG